MLCPAEENQCVADRVNDYLKSKNIARQPNGQFHNTISKNVRVQWITIRKSLPATNWGRYIRTLIAPSIVRLRKKHYSPVYLPNCYSSPEYYQSLGLAEEDIPEVINISNQLAPKQREKILKLYVWAKLTQNQRSPGLRNILMRAPYDSVLRTIFFNQSFDIPRELAIVPTREQSAIINAIVRFLEEDPRTASATRTSDRRRNGKRPSTAAVAAARRVGKFMCVALDGPAGAGKTTILRNIVELVQGHTHIVYTTIKSKLVAEVQGMIPTVCAMTLCKFLLVNLNVKPMELFRITGRLHNFQIDINDVTAMGLTIHHSAFQFLLTTMEEKIFGSGGGANGLDSHDAPHTEEFQKEGTSKKKMLIYLDEYSMVAVSDFLLLKTIAMSYTTLGYDVVLVVVGDKNQLNPIVTSYRDNAEVIIQNVDAVYSLTKNLRCIDKSYNRFITDFLNADNWLQVLRTRFVGGGPGQLRRTNVRIASDDPLPVVKYKRETLANSILNDDIAHREYDDAANYNDDNNDEDDNQEDIGGFGGGGGDMSRYSSLSSLDSIDLGDDESYSIVDNGPNFMAQSLGDGQSNDINNILGNSSDEEDNDEVDCATVVTNSNDSNKIAPNVLGVSTSGGAFGGGGPHSSPDESHCGPTPAKRSRPAPSSSCSPSPKIPGVVSIDYKYDPRHQVKDIALYADQSTYELLTPTPFVNKEGEPINLSFVRVTNIEGNQKIIPLAGREYGIINMDALLDSWIECKKRQKHIYFICKANRDNLYLNLSVAIKIARVVEKFNARRDRRSERVQDVKFVEYKFHNLPAFTFHRDLCSPDPHSANEICPYLPLVIGMRYTITKSIGPLKNGTIVFLLHYNLQREILVVVTENNSLYIVTPTLYSLPTFTATKELFDEVVPDTKFEPTYPSYNVYNYPIFPAVSINCFQSQGITIPESMDVHLNLNNFSKRECYVALSRIKMEKQIVSIILPTRKKK